MSRLCFGALGGYSQSVARHLVQNYYNIVSVFVSE